MNEKSYALKMTAQTQTSGCRSFVTAKRQPKTTAKRRVKMSFDESVQAMFVEDEPLLRRLAD